ncbi:MAG: hypothetical protein ACTSWI_06620 [Alphaproteobacteria bacterium]
MGTVGNSLIKGISPQQVSQTLESFYAYEQLRAHFVRAALNRLSGHAEIYAQSNNLWRCAPAWFRTMIMAIVIVGLIISIVSWLRN